MKIVYITDINLSKKSAAGIWTYMKHLVSINKGIIIGKGDKISLFPNSFVIAPVVGNFLFHFYLFFRRDKILSKGKVLHAQRPDFLFWFRNNSEKRLIATLHGDPRLILSKKNMISFILYSIMEKKVLTKIEKLIFVSENTKHKYELRFPQFSSKFIYVPVGIEVNKFEISNNEKNSFIFIGRLAFEKQVDKIIKQYKTYNGSEKLLIIGTGPEEKKLKIHAINDSRIEFIGFVENEHLNVYFQRAKALLMYSITEGFPMVVLESLAAGVPIISTPVGQLPNIITPDTGVLTYDIVPAFEKIKCIKSSNCRKLAEEFDWNSVANKMNDIYSV